MYTRMQLAMLYIRIHNILSYGMNADKGWRKREDVIGGRLRILAVYEIAAGSSRRIDKVSLVANFLFSVSERSESSARAMGVI